MSKSKKFSEMFKVESMLLFNTKIKSIEKEKSLEHNHNLECRICSTNINELNDLNGISIGVSTDDLKCDHVFHTSCIKNWLNCNNICPVCGKKNGGFLEIGSNSKIKINKKFPFDGRL